MLRRAAALALVLCCGMLCGGTAQALSPGTGTGTTNLDGLRIVLSWSAAEADLDSHLSYPDHHVYFERKTSDDARLDADGSDRDDGARKSPETMTLLRKQAGYGYTYAVHDFGNRSRPEASALSRSGARVSLYLGERLLRSYAVPQNRPGNLWRVFRIDGEGRFQDIDRIDASTAQAERIDTELDRLDGAGDDAGGDEIEAGLAGPAAHANQRGEAAYRAGNLEGAVALYQQSIELDPDYALAYSNLGLAYVKLGRSAEAIWASRKAIALARGANATTVRAGAYYNIGKLFEEAGRYDEAMSNYLSAKREQAHPTYDKAIERVRGL